VNYREEYTPGPAGGAQIRKDGEKWTLILVRELRHSPEKVWQALTDPAHLREWAPFEADGSLGTVGTTVKLTTVGAPTPHVTETRVTRADAPKALEYNWGEGAPFVGRPPIESGCGFVRGSSAIFGPARRGLSRQGRRLAATAAVSDPAGDLPPW
jgi:uncharacterized protein YndB with AHSA1/START domain